MFNNQIIRRITATLLAAFLVDAWTFEAALAARGSPVALSRSEGSEPALVTDTGLRQLAGRLMTAQPSSPKRIPQTEPQRSAPAPKPDIGAVDRYSRTLQSISAAIAAEEARGAIGRSSEAGAIGPNMHIMVKEPWTEDKATAVRTVLAHAKQAAPLEAAVERNFVAFDAHVQRHKLPSVIRERQHLAQTEFKANAARFHRAVTALQHAQARKDPTAANAALKDLAEIAGTSIPQHNKSLPWGAGK